MVSTVLIMIVTGRVSQHIIRGQKNKGAAAMQTVGTEAAADDKEDVYKRQEKLPEVQAESKFPREPHTGRIREQRAWIW